MNTNKLALKALLALIAMISDTKLRKMLRSALSLLLEAWEKDTAGTADALSCAEQGLKELRETLQREQRNADQKCRQDEAEIAGLRTEIGRLRDEAYALRAFKHQAAIDNSKVPEGNFRRQMRLSEEGRSNRIGAIKELREWLGLGLADAKSVVDAAYSSVGFGSVIVNNGWVVPSSRYWQA